MSRTAWIAVLVGGGVIVAIVIGLVATSQSRAQSRYCTSLDNLQTTVTNVANLSPATVEPGQLQTDLNAVQNAWGSVQSAASNLQDANQQSLDSAWNSFTGAVGGGSVSSAKQAAATFEQTISANLSSYGCPSG